MFLNDLLLFQGLSLEIAHQRTKGPERKFRPFLSFTGICHCGIVGSAIHLKTTAVPRRPASLNLAAPVVVLAAGPMAAAPVVVLVADPMAAAPAVVLAAAPVVAGVA